MGRLRKALGTISERIFSPSRLLLFLTIVNLIVYFDRGAIAAVLPKVSEQYALTITQEGAIASSFIVGYMICCPIFATLASYAPMKYLVMFGLMVWVFASQMLAWADFMTGEKWGYYMVLAARALVGVGESAFLSLAPTLVDDVAPPARRTMYMSIFTLGLPVGAALGYGVAGFMAVYLSWRAPFWLGSGLMAVCVAVMLWIPTAQRIHKRAKIDELNQLFDDFGEQHTDSVESQKAALVIDAGLLLSDTLLRSKESGSGGDTASGGGGGGDVDTGSDDEMEMSFLIGGNSGGADGSGTTTGSAKDKKYGLFSAAFALFLSPIWVSTVLASAFYTALIGCLSFFAPSYLTRTFDIPLEYASLSFSIVTVVTGLFGTLFGGIVNDLIGGSATRKGTANALLVSFLVVIVSFPIGSVAWFMSNIYVFFVLLFVAEFFLFAKTSPVNCALLSMVPPSLKNHSMSFYIFLIHLLGDFPAPLLFGVLADYTSEFIAILSLWALLIPCMVLLLLAWLLALWGMRKYEQSRTIRRLL